MATVHLIDDDEGMRIALGRVLGAAGYQVRAYATAGDYLLPDPGSEPGCLLLDFHLPGASGLDLQAALHRHPAYERPIIFMSGTADIHTSVQAMHGGARDFLLKPIGRDVLLAAVKDAVACDTERREARAHAQEARERIAALSGREQKVLAGIAAGQLHRDIAARLDVSERTIKADRARIMLRLEVRTLPGLLKLLLDASGEDRRA